MFSDRLDCVKGRTSEISALRKRNCKGFFDKLLLSLSVKYLTTKKDILHCPILFSKLQCYKAGKDKLENCSRFVISVLQMLAENFINNPRN